MWKLCFLKLIIISVFIPNNYIHSKADLFWTYPIDPNKGLNDYDFWTELHYPTDDDEYENSSSDEYFEETFEILEMEYDFVYEYITFHHENEDMISTTTESGNPISDDCPKQNSELSEDDLRSAVDRVIANNTIIDNINAGFYLNALAVHDKHYHTFKGFTQKIADRPKHAKHILSELESIRVKDITPVVDQLATKLQDLTTMENEFNDHSKTSKHLFGKLNNLKKLCALNCDDDDDVDVIVPRYSQLVKFPKRNSLNSDEDMYYCGHLDEVIKVIESKMFDFQHEFVTTMVNQTNEYDKFYEIKITNLKEKIKAAAVAKFGVTMYDLLSLEDDYHHLMKRLDSDAIHTQLSELRRNVSEINGLVGDLDDILPRYRRYCNTCKPLSRLRRSRYIHPTKNNPNLLNKVIADKIFEVSSKIAIDFANIFKDLNDKLMDENVIENIVNALEPIQMELTEDIKKELEEFNTIKQKIPNKTLGKLSKTNKNAFKLATQLKEALQFISQYV